MNNNFIICIMGPTASGKTDLSISLAKRIPSEIISVDSALIYKGMDLGTAKPTLDERCGIPHHLIDIVDPKESYSAANFRSDALKLIKEIHAKGKIPILVGGTMLYFNALIGGISNLPESTREMREHLNERLKNEGVEALHRELAGFDPRSAQRINATDPQRILRAIEVYLLSGKTMTELTEQNKQKPLEIKSYQFALMPKDREMLRARIAQRFKHMVEQGLIDEVRGLMNRGDLNEELPSIRCVGYRQCWSYLKGEMDYDEMIYRGTVATAQLAKRQMTWIRGWKFPLQILELDDPQNLMKILNAIEPN